MTLDTTAARLEVLLERGLHPVDAVWRTSPSQLAIDPEALDRWRDHAREGGGHDMSSVNKNTLVRLIGTIDALSDFIPPLLKERRELKDECASMLETLREVNDRHNAAVQEAIEAKAECKRLRGQSDLISDKSRLERLRRVVHRWITQGQVLGIVHDMDIQCEIDDAMAWVNENPEANGGEHDSK